MFYLIRTHEAVLKTLTVSEADRRYPFRMTGPSDHLGRGLSA